MLSRRKYHGLILMGSTFLFCLVLGIAPSAGQESASGFVPFTPPEVAEGSAALIGPHDSSQMLRLVIGLKHPHWAEEQQFIRDLQTPGKGQYHKFLTAEEYNERFAPSVEDEQAVVAWATAQGLTVTDRYPNRLLVGVEGNVATIQKAFNVSINRYQLGATTGFSNDRDPQVPAIMAGTIQSVAGLQNLHVMHALNSNAQEPAFPDYSSGPTVGMGPSGADDGDLSKLPQKSAMTPNFDSGPPYDPEDMFSTAAYDAYALYGLGHCCNPFHVSGGTPPETSIAIATAGTQNTSDFSGFHSTYPYLADHWFIHYIGGTPTCCDGEGTMDFEWSTAMSNSFGSLYDTASVHMYDGVDAGFGTFEKIYNQMISDGAARNFSTSWGCQESTCFDNADIVTTDGLFSTMTIQGWSLTAAAGDHGATASCNNSISVMYPASDPFVTGAGGTTMYLFGGPPPSFSSFSAWTGGPDGCSLTNPKVNDGGTGGGYSAFFGVPGYQSGHGFPSRGVPDIALNADWYNTPQWLYFGGGLSGNGGTSIVAPETVGFFAQENAYLLYLGNICGSGSSPCAPMGLVNTYLYDEGFYHGAPHSPYYDVTTGNNCNDVTTFYGLGCYSAGAGWDPVTGWGTYNFLQLAWAINWYHIPGTTSPAVSFSGPAINHWYNTDQVVSWTVAANPGIQGFPSSGLAGFSQAWDSDPGNEASVKATPGLSGFPGSPYDAFYDGPRYPNATSGCLDFTGASCAGWVGQGWHRVNVRAWGNEGERSGDATYGPIGFDTIAPVTTPHLSGTLFSGTTYKSAVTVTLTPVDPGAPTTGSGVASTVYQVNGEGLRTYSGPFTVSFPGTYTVTFHSADVAGNVESAKSQTFTIRSVISLSAASLAFGSQPFAATSAGKSVTLGNIGSAAVAIGSILASGDFAVSANTCPASLVGGASCAITVTYKPSVLGAVTGDVTVNYVGEGTPKTVALTGTGQLPITLSPTSLAFGSVAVGSTSAAKTVSLTNNESTTLSISRSASGDYSIAGTTCGATLASKASCTMNVTFHPKQNGSASGALAVTYNAGLSPQAVALSGTGTGGVTAPLTFAPSALAFTGVAVGTTASKTVTVTNSGASTITISAVSASADYTATGCVGVLAPTKACTLSVTFKPSTLGTTTGSVALTDNTIVSPEIYNVSGAAVSPLSFSVASLNFGTITVGTSSAAQSVTLTNNLGSALSPVYSVSGDYARTGGTCGAALAAHTSCTLFLAFTPKATGAITGVAAVGYASTFSPEEVKLTGTGQ